MPSDEEAVRWSVDCKRDPEAFRQQLLDVQHEIVDRFKKRIENTEQVSEATAGICLVAVKNAVEKTTNVVWKNFEVAERAEYLVKRSDETESKCKAWRPTTGKPDLMPIKCHALKKKKEHLQEYLHQLNAEVSLLEEVVDIKRRELHAFSDRAQADFDLN